MPWPTSYVLVRAQLAQEAAVHEFLDTRFYGLPLRVGECSEGRSRGSPGMRLGATLLLLALAVATVTASQSSCDSTHIVCSPCYKACDANVRDCGGHSAWACPHCLLGRRPRAVVVSCCSGIHEQALTSIVCVLGVECASACTDTAGGRLRLVVLFTLYCVIPRCSGWRRAHLSLGLPVFATHCCSSCPADAVL